jgi:hypothetical protein
MLRLFKNLKNEFVQDNGCLCCFFLNHFHLKSGEAIYIPVNVLHTYLSGDIIECMAVSDNVIRYEIFVKIRFYYVSYEFNIFFFFSRCGLSSKPKDLCSLLKVQT